LARGVEVLPVEDGNLELHDYIEIAKNAAVEHQRTLHCDTLDANEASTLSDNTKNPQTDVDALPSPSSPLPAIKDTSPRKHHQSKSLIRTNKKKGLIKTKKQVNSTKANASGFPPADTTSKAFLPPETPKSPSQARGMRKAWREKREENNAQNLPTFQGEQCDQNKRNRPERAWPPKAPPLDVNDHIPSSRRKMERQKVPPEPQIHHAQIHHSVHPATMWTLLPPGTLPVPVPGLQASTFVATDPLPILDEVLIIDAVYPGQEQQQVSGIAFNSPVGQPDPILRLPPPDLDGLIPSPPLPDLTELQRSIASRELAASLAAAKFSNLQNPSSSCIEASGKTEEWRPDGSGKGETSSSSQREGRALGKETMEMKLPTGRRSPNGKDSLQIADIGPPADEQRRFNEEANRQKKQYGELVEEVDTFRRYFVESVQQDIEGFEYELRRISRTKESLHAKLQRAKHERDTQHAKVQQLRLEREAALRETESLRNELIQKSKEGIFGMPPNEEWQSVHSINSDDQQYDPYQPARPRSPPPTVQTAHTPQNPVQTKIRREDCSVPKDASGGQASPADIHDDAEVLQRETSPAVNAATTTSRDTEQAAQLRKRGTVVPNNHATGPGALEHIDEETDKENKVTVRSRSGIGSAKLQLSEAASTAFPRLRDFFTPWPSIPKSLPHKVEDSGSKARKQFMVADAGPSTRHSSRHPIELKHRSGHSFENSQRPLSRKQLTAHGSQSDKGKHVVSQTSENDLREPRSNYNQRNMDRAVRQERSHSTGRTRHGTREQALVRHGSHGNHNSERRSRATRTSRDLEHGPAETASTLVPSDRRLEYPLPAHRHPSISRSQSLSMVYYEPPVPSSPESTNLVDVYRQFPFGFQPRTAREVSPTTFFISMLLTTKSSGSEFQVFRIELDRNQGDDKLLFQKLKETYHGIRGWRRRFSFKGVTDIKFARVGFHFQMHRSSANRPEVRPRRPPSTSILLTPNKLNRAAVPTADSNSGCAPNRLQRLRRAQPASALL
jgi:hypothetical protein